MPGPSDLELALRIKAQTEGREQVDGLGESLNKVGEKTPENLKVVDQALDTLEVKVTDSGNKVDTLDKTLGTLGDGAEGGLRPIGQELSTLGAKAVDGQAKVDQLDKALDALGDGETDGLKGVNQELKGMGEKARETEHDLEQAFSVLGVRRMDDIRYQIKTLEQAFDAIKNSGKASADDISHAEAALARQIAALNAELGNTNVKSVTSAEALRSAFGVVGVRAANQIQAEIHEIDVALMRLALDTKTTGQEFDRAWSAGQAKLAALHAEMQGTTAAVGGIGQSISGIGGIVTSIGPQVAAAFGAKQFIDTNVAMEAARRSLVLLSGGQQQAAQEMEYLRATSNRLGMELETASKSYISLYAATKGTALEGEQTRKVFEAVTNAMGMLGKSSAETENALRAVAQIASKGTVQMEELRGQLGEALPGALKAAADGMGITVQQLIAMVESGDVLAKDLLPKLAEALNKVYATQGQVEGSVASLNRLKNAVTGVMDRIGQSGVMSGLASAAEGAAKGVNQLWDKFEGLGKALGIVTSAVTHLTSPMEGLNSLQEEAARNALRAGETYTLTGKALDDLRHRAGLTQAEIDRLNGVQSASVPAANQAATAAQMSANASKGLADALRDTVRSTEAATKASSTLAEARKQEGATAVMVAQMSGNEIEIRKASTKAAEDYATAVKQDLANNEQMLAAKQKLLAQLKDEAAASGEVSAKKQDEIKALQESIVTQTAAVEKARQLAEASEFAALKARSAAETYGDQSAKVEEYGRAVEAAKTHLEALQAAEAKGAPIKEQVKAATLELADANSRYRDSLSDATKAASLHIQQLNQSASLEQKQLSVVRDRYQAIYEVAKAQGREGEAARAMQEIRRVEIQMQEAQAKASRAQAKAIIAAAKAKEAELAASGQLTEAAKAEINARIQEAEVKKLDAEHAEILAKKLRDLSNATSELKTNSRGATDGLRDSLDGAAAASDRLNSSLAARPSGESKFNFDPNASTTVGTYSGLGTDAKVLGLREGLEGAALERFIAYYQANIDTATAQAYIDDPGGAHIIGHDPGAGALKSVVNQAVEYARTGGVAFSSNMPKSSSSQSSSSGSTSHTITITLPNGATQTVNAASANDASALTSLLQQLGQAQSTSSLRLF